MIGVKTSKIFGCSLFDNTDNQVKLEREICCTLFQPTRYKLTVFADYYEMIRVQMDSLNVGPKN